MKFSPICQFCIKHGKRPSKHSRDCNAPDPIRAIKKWSPEGSGVRQTTVTADHQRFSIGAWDNDGQFIRVTRLVYDVSLRIFLHCVSLD